MTTNGTQKKIRPENSQRPDLHYAPNRLQHGKDIEHTMTSVLKPIAGSLRTTDFLLPICLDDLRAADVETRVRGGEGPSIEWQTAHMLQHRRGILELLGGASEPADWREVAAALEAAMEAATDETLARGVVSGVHGGAETVLDSIIFLVWHEAYHMGSLVAIRKELGYPSPAEILIARKAV